ncbi:MAG: stage sporulation protein [Peptococcaceae bacterium]|jgi:stage III sporulation protein AB|nr:stage sporulation protein [Peptococcaceae bacterium]
MVKFIGALCIISGCGYLGLNIAQMYKKRVELLRMLQSGLNLLETEINYTSTPLPLALKRVADKLHSESRILFEHAGRLLSNKKGVTAGEAWREGVKVLVKEIPLTNEEINILTLFGYGLGISAKEDQLKNLALVKEQLHMAEMRAVQRMEKHQRMWQYLGFCLGAVVVLILI